MGRLTREVMEAAARIGCRANPLPDHALTDLRAQLTERFASGLRRIPMWEYFAESSSVQEAKAWTWLAEFTAGKPLIMFFDPDEDRSGVAFDDGNCIGNVLGECTGFEFYLTNPEGDYIICFNHHDFLIGTGSAMDWINQKREGQPS